MCVLASRNYLACPAETQVLSRRHTRKSNFKSLIWETQKPQGKQGSEPQSLFAPGFKNNCMLSPKEGRQTVRKYHNYRINRTIAFKVLYCQLPLIHKEVKGKIQNENHNAQPYLSGSIRET